MRPKYCTKKCKNQKFALTASETLEPFSISARVFVKGFYIFVRKFWQFGLFWPKILSFLCNFANFCMILSFFCTYFVCSVFRLKVVSVLFCKFLPSLMQSYNCVLLFSMAAWRTGFPRVYYR